MNYIINESKVEFDELSYLKPSLGIKRKDMPQLRVESLIENKQKFLKKGIGVVEMKVPCNLLKPTQNEINIGKVMCQIAEKNKPSERVYVCSNDLHIMDGHHGHVQQLIEDEKHNFNLFVLDLPAKKCVELLNGMKEFLNHSKDINDKINESIDILSEGYLIGVYLDEILSESYGIQTPNMVQGMGSVSNPSVGNSSQIQKLDGSGDMAMANVNNNFITVDQLAKYRKAETDEKEVVSENYNMLLEQFTREQLKNNFDLISKFLMPHEINKIMKEIDSPTSINEKYNNGRQSKKQTHFTSESASKLPLKTCMNRPTKRRCLQIDTEFSCDTLEGITIGKAGDMLVVGVDGEVYPCDKTIFDETYVILGDAETE